MDTYHAGDGIVKLHAHKHNAEDLKDAMLGPLEQSCRPDFLDCPCPYKRTVKFGMATDMLPDLVWVHLNAHDAQPEYAPTTFSVNSDKVIYVNFVCLHCNHSLATDLQRLRVVELV